MSDVLTGKQNEGRPLDFNILGEPLNKLLIATSNKLSREWPRRYWSVRGSRELFVMHVRTSRMTYLSALYLAADKPPDPLRLPEFCASIPVLNRSILDSLLMMMFIMEDVPSRVAWFWEADWKAMRLELDRYVKEYGALPDWKQWLSALGDHCAKGAEHAALTAAQTSNPQSLRSWLNPGAMVRYGIAESDSLPANRAFMKYLDDYFYIDLSQQSHLGAWGMAKRGAVFLDEVQNDPNREEGLKKNRYANLGQSVGLVLALASEIEAHFNFGLSRQALYVWGIARPVIAVVEEMYQKRYKELLV